MLNLALPSNVEIGEEEEEDMSPTLQLHNFVEFHIEKGSLNPQRAEAIKSSLVEFMEELQKNPVKKAQGDTSGATTQSSLQGRGQAIPSGTEDVRTTILKRIGRQVNI